MFEGQGLFVFRRLGPAGIIGPIRFEDTCR